MAFGLVDEFVVGVEKVEDEKFASVEMKMWKRRKRRKRKSRQAGNNGRVVCR